MITTTLAAAAVITPDTWTRLAAAGWAALAVLIGAATVHLLSGLPAGGNWRPRI
jgi:hypothetical protein